MEGIAIKNNNKIMYNDNGVNVIVCVKEDAIFVERSCKDYRLTLHLSIKNITQSDYNINGLGQITLQTKTEQLLIEENMIEASYIVDFGEGERTRFKFLLKMEELI